MNRDEFARFLEEAGIGQVDIRALLNEVPVTASKTEVVKGFADAVNKRKAMVGGKEIGFDLPRAVSLYCDDVITAPESDPADQDSDGQGAPTDTGKPNEQEE